MSMPQLENHHHDYILNIEDVASFIVHCKQLSASLNIAKFDEFVYCVFRDCVHENIAQIKHMHTHSTYTSQIVSTNIVDDATEALQNHIQTISQWSQKLNSLHISTR
eukprot:m.54128 g.54128  ORF g.54128 m.54128 type:complete len:107 (-) comp15481_c0_seq1:182-502(-)